MATVYISKDLLGRVSSKIGKLKNHERSEAVPNYSYKIIGVDASDLFNKIQFKEKPELLELIPKAWLSTQDYATIEVHIKKDDVLHKLEVRVEGLKSYFERPTREHYGNGVANKCTKEFLEAHSYFTGAYEILKKTEQAITLKEIDLRWQKTLEQVNLFLGKCKSLNEAIKLWPQVALYIEDEDMERFNKKVERKAREDVLANIDTDELTAMAIAAKLSGAF